MTNKTVVIYDQCGEEHIKFFILDGDYRHLNNRYINSFHYQKESEELSNLIYDNTTGHHKITLLDEFPYDEVKNGAYVIVAGFLP